MLQSVIFNSHKTFYNRNVTLAVVPVLKKGAHVIQMGTCSGAWIMVNFNHIFRFRNSTLIA